MIPAQLVPITLTPGELSIVTRPVVGRGGMQVLLRKILQRLNRETRAVTLYPQEVARIRHYAHYCPGGYEDRFLALEAAIDRALAAEVA